MTESEESEKKSKVHLHYLYTYNQHISIQSSRLSVYIKIIYVNYFTLGRKIFATALDRKRYINRDDVH